ncbi:MAG TPA: response regulator [Gemmatimonadota bacterium]|nr:response regulator [Gemmatimonadota bacterium]
MIPPIRVLIVDDEPPARENLRVLLEAEPDVEIVGERGSGPRAVEAIESLAPDLVFLDVQMPGMDGFGVIEALGAERMPVVVFVTAYDRYALRAFEARALDYLLKPFDDRRFAEALSRARERIREQGESDLARRLASLLEDRRDVGDHGDRWLTHLTVRERDRVVVLKVDEVDRFEAAGDYVEVHVGRRRHLLDDTMKSLEERLDPRRFVRIHRSHIIRVDRIRELHPFFHGDYVVVLEGGAELRLSRGRREALEQALGRAL